MACIYGAGVKFLAVNLVDENEPFRPFAMYSVNPDSKSGRYIQRHPVEIKLSNSTFKFEYDNGLRFNFVLYDENHLFFSLYQEMMNLWGIFSPICEI